MMKRSKNLEQRQQSAIEEKSKLLKNIESSESLAISQLEYHKKQLAELENVSISYGSKTVCENVSFTIEQGERIALSGKNGSGKSSILKLICGEDLQYTGHLSRDRQLKISYVSQDTSHLRGSLSDYATSSGIDESLFKSILRKLDFSGFSSKRIFRLIAGDRRRRS